MALENLLTTAQAAAILGVKPQTLNEWRSTKLVMIPFYKVGRAVRYKESELEAWLEAQRVAS